MTEQHEYRFWGLGHMSDPDDPQSCCDLPENHPIHQAQSTPGDPS